MGAFLWSIVEVSNTLLFLALIGVVLLFFKRRRSGTVLAAIGIIGFILWGISPIGTLLITPLETRFPQVKALPDDIAGIIILGGSVEPVISGYWGQPGLNDRVERLTEGIALALAHPDLPLAFSGGLNRGEDGPPSEAAVAGYLFHQMHVTNPVILEDRARNTHDNAQFLKPLLPKDRTGPWVLVTSSYHMPRSVGVFRAAGIDVIPYPVDFKSIPEWSGWSYEVVKGAALADFAMREWLALLAYYERGWIASPVPGP